MILLPPKVTFPSSENIFSTNHSFRLMETFFSVWWKQCAFVQSFFSTVGNHYENKGEPILKEKHFPVSGKHFLRFYCQKKQFSGIVETYFSTNASFPVVETDFFANTNRFLIYFPETPASENSFLSSGHHPRPQSNFLKIALTPHDFAGNFYLI